MKKLKLFLLLFVAAVAAGNFTACEDKDDDNSSIIGTWLNNEVEYETISLTFTADGRFVETYTYQGQSQTNSGTFTYDGEILTLIYDDGKVESGPAILSGDTLTIDGIDFTKQ